MERVGLKKASPAAITAGNHHHHHHHRFFSSLLFSLVLSCNVLFFSVMPRHVMSYFSFSILFFSSYFPPSFFSPLHVLSLPFAHFSLVYSCIPLFFISYTSSLCILFYLIVRAFTYLICFSFALFIYFARPPSISIIFFFYTYTDAYTYTYTLPILYSITYTHISLF